MQVEINIVNAFTKYEKGGNPAAVVLDADHLSPAQKQQIAKLAGLSETVFISKSAIAAFKFDFFTPVRQIADCGHATVAAFAYLKQTGRIQQDVTVSSKEIIDGRREIIFKAHHVFMEQKAPSFSDISKEDYIVVAASLGLTNLKFTPVMADNGNRFLFLEVENQAVLAELKPDMEQLSTYSEKLGLIGYYIYCSTPNADATTRMFAPAYGIPEESATGMAAGPLAAFMYQFKVRKQHYQIEQGHFMNPPSASLIQVHLQVEDGRIKALYAGGIARLVNRLIVEI